MPIIKTDKIQVKSHALMGIEANGDNLLYNHVQNITPDLEFCHEMRNAPGNGFSDDRQRRHIGRIPDMIWLEHPEWNDDPELVKKWLKTEEGRPFRTVGRGL